MNSLPEWLNGVVSTLKLWYGAMDQALVYWPGAIAALATVLTCTTAAFLILDASRRTAGVPGWGYLQRSVGLLSAERDTVRRVVDALAGERDGLREELESLKRDKLRYEGIHRQREHEEQALRDVMERLKSIGEDRAKVEALRAELEGLRTERASLTQAVIALREEQNERQTTLDRRRARLNELEDEIAKMKTAREALVGEVAQRKLESDSYQRQCQQFGMTLEDSKKMLRESDAKLKEIGEERDRLTGEVRALQGRIGQLQAERRDVEEKIVAAQAARTKMASENGRLEADRSTLWIEFVALQEKRNAANGEIAVSETKLRDLRHQRDALHGEIEMLRRVLGTMGVKAAESAAASA
jgi:chromosome segregation ATPase